MFRILIRMKIDVEKRRKKASAGFEPTLVFPQIVSSVS